MSSPSLLFYLLSATIYYVLPCIHHTYDRKTGVCVGACAALCVLNIHQTVNTAMHVGLTALGLIAGAEWILDESGC